MTANILGRTTELAKTICEKYTGENVTAIDATCGNGWDTIWLAERCTEVYAFDVQERAVLKTRSLAMEKGLSNIKVIHAGHENMTEYVREKAGLIMFNLGYLPGGDKEITTESPTTLKALDAALGLLAKDGLICVIMYWGHPKGAEERKAVMDWASHLDKSLYHCVHTDMINQPNCPPEILFVTKKNEENQAI